MSVVGPIAAKKLHGRECNEVFLLQQNSLVINQVGHTDGHQPFAERALRNVRLAGHSGLMPANLTTLAHFSVSSAMNLPKSAAGSASTVPPNPARRALSLGSARAASISLLSFSTISVGVPLGAPRPSHALAS